MLPAAIVFDFDGVLANSEPLHLTALQDALAMAGIALTAEEYYARYLGYDDEGALRAILADRKRTLSEPEFDRVIADKVRRVPALLAAPEVLMPGAVDCVARLAANRPLAIASGARRDEIELVLTARGLAAPFSVIVAAGETPRSKPYPDPYARAVALLGERGLVPAGTAPGACVAIEDSRWGIASAREAGLRCVGITSSYSREELDVADHVVDSLDELTVDLLARVVGQAW